MKYSVSIFSQKVKRSRKMQNIKTDWTQYYENKKSFFSTYTQRYTTAIINKTIKDYVAHDKNGIMLCEFGGGNSCFAQNICSENDSLSKYDIVDNNELAVSLFNKMNLDCEHHGILCNLLSPDCNTHLLYDFVYSIGLIEHFSGNDVAKIIERHFEFCKLGGIVLISFPTPTKKYLLTRKVMEILGKWRFFDETPLVYSEVRDTFKNQGVILEHFINKKLPLSQYVVITKKT